VTQAFRIDANRSAADLEASLRRSLREARGNPEIRRRLARLAGDPERIETLRRELGPGHALLRDLRLLAPEPAAGAAQAPGETRRVGSSSAGGRSAAPQLWTPSTQS
jgi:hypothetical protein